MKGLLSILLALPFYSSFSQEKPALVFVNIEGNYAKLSKEDGTPSNGQSSNTKTLFIGSSVSFYKNAKISIGLGVDYGSEKEKRESVIMLDGITDGTTTVSEKIIRVDVMDLKSSALIYNVHIAYTKAITNNFFFISTFKVNYGIINASYRSIPYTMTYFGDDTNYPKLHTSPSIDHTIQTENYNNKYFGLNVCPELLYFISNHYGFFIKANGIAFTMYDWKKQNTSWLCNLSPSFWNFGITVKI